MIKLLRRQLESEATDWANKPTELIDVGRRKLIFWATATALCGQPRGAYALPLDRDRSGRVIVPVRINDRGPFRFALDTGATVSVVSSWLAAELHLPAAPEGEMLMNGALGRKLVNTVLIERLEADGLSSGVGRLALFDPESLGQVDGLLGADRLRDQRLDIDFSTSQIALAPSAHSAPPRGASQLRAKRRFEVLLALPGCMGPAALWAILDTGAQRSVGNVPLQRALGEAAAKPLHGETLTVHGAGGERLSAALLATPALRLGGVELPSAPIAFADLPAFRAWEFDRRPAMLLGMDLLGGLDRLTIDYPRSRVLVSRS